MKKNRTIKAFSLAEAMITLLIVCLITLASIPVITKKKRTPDTSAHGAYYCTKRYNAETKNYDLVHYSTTNPVGNKDDISTWELVGENAQHCKFVPPINAKNFAVTLIGGGGAGSRGDATLQEVLSDDKPTYTPTEEREYQLAMIGGGGGGASCYSSPNGDAKGRGGSGGASGGFIIGKVKLKKDIKYGFVKGTGGNKSNNNLDDDDPGYGGEGGETIFKYEKDNGASGSSWKKIFEVTGGGGGQQLECDHDCGDKDCSGGLPSVPGVARLDLWDTSVILSSINSDDLKFGSGFSGDGYGHNNVVGAYTNAGKGITFNGNDYGQGGRGCFRGTCQEPGTDGHFSLSLINLFGGEGGSAALPEIVTIPKIPGYLEISVGLGGTSDEKANNPGGNTTVQVFNKAGIPLRKYWGYGGAAGRFRVQNVATPGQNSLWTDKGGGAVGVCYPPSEAWTETNEKTVTVRTGKCNKIIGVGGSKVGTSMARQYDWTKNIGYPYYWDEANIWPIGGYELMNYCPKRANEVCASDDYQCQSTTPHQLSLNRGQIARGEKALWSASYLESQYGGSQSAAGARCHSVYYCSPRKALDDLHAQGYYVKTGVNETSGFGSAEQYDSFFKANMPFGKKFMCIFKPDYQNDGDFKEAYDAFAQSKDYDALWKYLRDTTVGGKPKYFTYWTPSDGSATSNFKYECAEFEEKIQTVYETIYHPAGETPAHCDKASNGTGFGAGGGGGQYTEQIGVYGLGGDGAPGAVIVEW